MAKYVSLLLLLVWQTTSYAQLRVDLKADTNRIMIGDPIHLTCRIEAEKGVRFQYPQWGDTLSSHFEIWHTAKIDTLVRGNTSIYTQGLTVSSYDSGEFYIPPVHLDYFLPGDTSRHFVESDPIPVMVVQPQVDMSKGFMDIKEPLDAKFTIYEILPYLLGGILLLALMALLVIYILRRRKKKAATPKPEKPPLPPREMALQSLEELRLKKLWQQGKEKAYYTELVDILRTYLHDEFAIDSFEMTSDEILESIAPLGINREAVNKLKMSLGVADLVKFAKLKPAPMENDLALLNVVDFVKESFATKPQQSEQPAMPPQPVSGEHTVEIQTENKEVKEEVTPKEQKDV